MQIAKMNQSSNPDRTVETDPTTIIKGRKLFLLFRNLSPLVVMIYHTVPVDYFLVQTPVCL